MRLTEPFTPIPNAMLEALLRSRLTRGQWQILMWVIRNTLGWNREAVAFSWYQIAKEVGMNRSSVLRAGRGLLKAALLFENDGRLGVQTDLAWGQALQARTGAATHRKRRSQTPFFRRAKDIRKERYKESNHPAGAANPVPGNYDHTAAN